MTTWASEELQSVELGDQRLNNRLKVLVETLASCPEGSIPQACNGDPAGLKAAKPLIVFLIMPELMPPKSWPVRLLVPVPAVKVTLPF